MGLNIANTEWGEFEIGDIFTVSTGGLIDRDLLKKGSIPRITATDKNNGVYGFYKKLDHKNYKELSNFISVSFLGSVFYHPYTASLDMKIHAMQIEGFHLNKYLAEFLILCLKRTVSIFSYGDQLSSSDLPKKKILLPLNRKRKPDYVFMEQFMRAKEQEKLEQYAKFVHKKLEWLKDYKEVKPLNEKEWKEFSINDVFNEIQRGKRLKKDNHKIGNMPYVSSTAANNGVDCFIGNKGGGVRVFSDCITIANSGSVGASFYQPFSFIASDHVTKLRNQKFNRFVYLFISQIIKRFSEKYSFNREINDDRIKREKILLPINLKNEPDYEYMENYIKKIEFEKLSQYLKYKKDLMASALTNFDMLSLTNLGYNQTKNEAKMQTVVLNINESVAEKFFWLLKHFDKNEIEVVDFDTSLEALIDKGLESKVSPLTHKEVFDGFKAKYAKG